MQLLHSLTNNCTALAKYSSVCYSVPKSSKFLLKSLEERSEEDGEEKENTFYIALSGSAGAEQSGPSPN